MAVPTFTSVTPSSGPVGGRNVVTIVGTNFNLPPAQAATGAGVSYPDSVIVEFDGQKSERVDVISATQLRVTVPTWRRMDVTITQQTLPLVNIKISNADTAGDPIAGEDVTALNAYQFKRPALRPPDAQIQTSIYQQVIEETVAMFIRQVTPNTAIGTNVDFGDNGQIIITSASHPSVTLVGPRLEEDLNVRHHWNYFLEEQQGNGPPETVHRKWPGFVSNFEFDFVLGTDNRSEMYAMVQSIAEMFMRNPFLIINGTFGDVNSTPREFPFQLIQPPQVTIQDPNANVLAAVGTFQVRWVPFRLDEPVDISEEVNEGEIQAYGQNATTPVQEVVPFADQDP